ncbi:NAD-dependent epimerase [Marivirga lumbricoides]|uniref:NAD-dependent epimerase n=1 Tax=Marivirga lumbricoides TaxID=1046115 RepID=A0ABQ1ME59_9BACT|nr:NAD-dependent epimerase [Marivirga lumbricoides]
MPEKILISGGSGMIGMQLSKLLSENGYEVAHLTRKKKTNYPYRQFEWDIKSQSIDSDAIKFADAIFHLAGAGVVDEKWTEERKKAIISSRTDSATLLKTEIEKQSKKIEHFIGASGINYYGMDTGNQLMMETNPAGEGFLPYVCEKWEEATDEVGKAGIKTAKVRIGIVLSDKGGALKQLAMPIKIGLGAPLGSGDQFMSWIHIDDLCRLFMHLLKNRLTGTFNGAAPKPVTNKALTKATAKALKKPLWLPKVPPFAMKLILSDRADMVLGGVKASSDKIEKTGFSFLFNTVEEALKDIYS